MNGFDNSWHKKIFYFITYYCSTFLKASYIVGSSVAFFSGASMTVPLVGVIADLTTLGFVSIVSMVVYVIRLGFNPFLLMVYHLPGFFAACYLNTYHWTIGLMVPISCMTAFIMHPVGATAWLYSLYWFIPILLFPFRKKVFYLDAVSSTFIAHAVGSSLWIYAKPMSPMVWNQLIPLVLIERFLFSVGIAALYYLIQGYYKLSHYKRYTEISVSKYKNKNVHNNIYLFDQQNQIASR